VVLAGLDDYANGVRARQVVRYLTGRGHDTVLMDTRALSRLSQHRGSWAYRVPSWRPLRALLYVAEVLVWLVGKRPVLRRRLSYPLYSLEQSLRRRLLRRPIADVRADLVICEVPQDSTALLDVTGAATLYDCPTPWADELYDEGRLTERQHLRMRDDERSLDDAVDHLAFHWRSYGWYAREHYGLRGDNLRVLDWGCEPVEQRAQFAGPPRIVYLGSLSSRFINLPLLAALNRMYAYLDVYGGPEPDPALGLNWLGPASPTILANYQLGIITCTKDALRRDGFSAKHLHYLAAGLPVLVPAWRRHLELLRGSQPYDEASFLNTIERLSDPVRWQAASDEAYAQACELTWERTLQPLDALLDTGPVTAGRPRSTG
jgi:hypothetical protein